MGYSEQDNEYGFISRIQRYSINDGPGIRTTVFFKGCSMDCVWCSNPELINPTPEILSNKHLCLHCGECHEACTEGAILLDQGEYVIERSLCNVCGRCVEVCLGFARELVGRCLSVDELVTELMKDQVFYNVSEGGVTFSGGEPAMQHEFAIKLAQDLKSINIHVAFDTCGNVPWKHLEELSDVVDLFLYDIKLMDDEKHGEYTGVSNALVLTNAKRLSALGVPMIIRLVIIPGCNDSVQEINDKLSFIMQLDSVKQVDILPYHKLGVGKYGMLGRNYLLKDLMPPDHEILEKLKSNIQSRGLKVSVGG